MDVSQAAVGREAEQNVLEPAADMNVSQEAVVGETEQKADDDDFSSAETVLSNRTIQPEDEAWPYGEHWQSDVIELPDGTRTVEAALGEGESDTEGFLAEDAKEEEPCLPPHFVDFFAGCNSPMARAMMWCGWSASIFEKHPNGCNCDLRTICGGCTCGMSKDLTFDEVRLEAIGQLKRSQASWSAMDCRTLTRAREKPIPGHPKPPKQLRGTTDLWGKELAESGTLSYDERNLLREHNDLLRFNFQILEVVEEMNLDSLVHVHVQENPSRSLEWLFPEMKLPGLEVEGEATPTEMEHPWCDTVYRACEWGGIRMKEQRLRSTSHHLPGAFAVISVSDSCAHAHASDEWVPYEDPTQPVASSRRWIYPTALEREYPARMVWQAAVALSWDAVVHLGYRMKIPRSPALEPMKEGDHTLYLQLPPAVVSWLSMPRIGMQLMLSPPAFEGHLPPVVSAALLTATPPGAIYCGQNLKRKFTCPRKYENPFEKKPGYTGEESTLWYIQWWMSLEEHEQVQMAADMVGKVLITEVAPLQPSHVYFLSSMVAHFIHTGKLKTTARMPMIPLDVLVPKVRVMFDDEEASDRKRQGWFRYVTRERVGWTKPVVSCSPAAKTMPDKKGPAKRALQLAVTVAMMQMGQSLPHAVVGVHSQESFNKFVYKIVPQECIPGLRVPMIEDLLNSEPCNLWARFLAEGNSDEFGAAQVTASLGQQPGVLNSKRALAPMLTTGMGKHATFLWGQQLCAEAHLPFDTTPATPDMRFLAEWAVATRGVAREQRSKFKGILQELARRTAPLHTHMKRQATANRVKLIDIHVGFVLAVMFIIGWKDHELPSRLLMGHAVVGPIPATGVFESKTTDEQVMTVAELVSKSHRADVIAAFQQKPVSEHRQFIVDSCVKEAERGWASGFLTESEVDLMFPDGWCPTPAFVHEQSCGKLRRIDDAKAGGGNSTTTYAEQIRMTTAMQPAVYARLAMSIADSQSTDFLDDELQHGNEDQPDAYRGLPVAQKNLCCNIVMLRGADMAVMFQVVYALLFGFKSSVMHYLSWAEFQQAFARRLLVLMWSIYVDSNVVDFKSNRGSAQEFGRFAFGLLGTPFAELKSKSMTAANDHLGVVTDLSKAVSKRVISFWPRQSLCDKVLGMISEFRATNILTPAMSSKFRGIVQFTALPMAYRVGRAGLGLSNSVSTPIDPLGS